MNAVNLQQKLIGHSIWQHVLYACYFSVYTSIYLCYSFWYRFESSLL